MVGNLFHGLSDDPKHNKSSSQQHIILELAVAKQEGKFYFKIYIYRSSSNVEEVIDNYKKIKNKIK